jgi:hypothetical protein
MLGPRSARYDAVELPLEPEVATPYPITISVDGPTWSFLLKGLPVLIPRVSIANLSGIDDPSEPMLR